MDAKQYWKRHGSEKSREVATAAGTSWGYFEHIMHGRRRPSPELAERLVEASGGQMDFVSLLKPRAARSKKSELPIEQAA